MSASTIETLESDETLGKEVCGICRRQISRYTCPSCNLFYCSLNCFRSESHSKCSEIFYRKEIETGIKVGPSKTEEERRKTIEMLKRIEDQSAADEDWLFDRPGGESEDDSLASRLSGMDISSASADDLLRLLTKQERDKFFDALKDPSSEIARELLESTELEKTSQLPWWEENDNVRSPLSAHVPYGKKPDLMVIPTDVLGQASRGISLLYNICAVLLAYAYVTRHLSMSPLAAITNDSQDQREARRILLQSIPFLVDHRSKLRYVSLTEVVISFWSRLDPGSAHDKIIRVLLEDVAKLVRPRRVTVAESSSEGREAVTVTALTTYHPFATTMMAMSDMVSLFSAGNGSSAVPRRNKHVVLKLTFYAAHYLATSSSRLHTLADEVNLLSKSLFREAR